MDLTQDVGATDAWHVCHLTAPIVSGIVVMA